MRGDRLHHEQGIHHRPGHHPIGRRLERQFCRAHEARARLEVGKHLAVLYLYGAGPIALALTVNFVPHLGQLYTTAPWKELLPALIFGFLWGIAQATFGIAIEAVGMALAIAVVVGLTGFLGSLIPMLVLHPAELLHPRGIALMISLPILVLALTLYGIAGRRREKEQPRPANEIELRRK